LHAAATCANLEICKILIENKADLLAVNTDGNMPYDICDDEVCLEYIESEMAAKGVTQQTIDMKRSETEMKMLDDLKQIYLQQLILINNSNKPASNNKTNNSKNNSFLNCFTNPFVNIKRNNGLIEQCLDLNAKDSNGATLMHIASANGYNTILLFLLNDCQIAAESGAPVIPPTLTCRDNDGWTPLHVATFWGHQKAIEILLENGADIDLRTNNDETVLELCDDPDVRDFIIQKSKEIDVHHKERQAQARAAAALQIKLQIINNNNNIVNNNNNNNNNQRPSGNVINGSNGSIRSVAEKSNSYNNVNGNISSSNNSNNNILSSINNSTRSLKRTSTGVSRRLVYFLIIIK
jgi:protein phosphatase 1 regulatory subunit 16A